MLDAHANDLKVRLEASAGKLCMCAKRKRLSSIIPSEEPWIEFLLSERFFRRALIAIAIAGLVLGFVAWSVGRSDLAQWCWVGGTVPVIIGLLISIVRDLSAGRLGVDSIALISMSGAVLLGQALAGIVIAIMYAGGNCSKTSLLPGRSVISGR